MKKTLNSTQTRAIKNAFTPEGQAAADALIEAIEAMAAEETELSVEDIDTRVNEVLAGLKQLPEPVMELIHNAIELKMKAISNVASKTTISKEVKNKVARAIMESTQKEQLLNEIDAVLKENGITGLTHNDVIDYAIADKFGNENPIFNQLHQTKVSKFFYASADMSTAAAIAKQWSKSSTAEKDIEVLEVTPKTITTAYVYKRQQVANEDLDDIRRAGEEENFLEWITAELYRVLANTVVMAILTGDAVNANGKKITVFESIATKTVTDLFTLFVQAAATFPTVAEVRGAADKIYNPNGYKKVAIMSAETKTALAGYTYASGGDLYFRSDSELAGQLGVDEIHTTDLMAGKGVIVMLPEEYWVLEKNTIDIAYPQHEHNLMNWQVERNIGGKIHGLLSTAYIKPHA